VTAQVIPLRQQLCRGLPSDWWTCGDDGARLAMAICRRCPDRLGCAEGDPRPYGVVRAGAPFSDTGVLLGDCPTCGYPQPGDRVAQRDKCPRCELPPLSTFRSDIEAWIAAGADNKTIGARVGATARQVRDARQHWHKRTKRTHPSPASCPATQLESEAA
jgi:hypothetical protein